MEPMNATVNFQPDRLDVWVGTQDAEMALGAAARVSGLKPEQVHIHNAFLGEALAAAMQMTISRKPSPSRRSSSVPSS